MTDWGLAFQVAGVGFSTVFGVLGGLALILWAVVSLLRAMESRRRR